MPFVTRVWAPASGTFAYLLNSSNKAILLKEDLCGNQVLSLVSTVSCNPLTHRVILKEGDFFPPCSVSVVK